MRNAVFITIAVIFGTMLYRVSKAIWFTVDTSCFSFVFNYSCDLFGVWS